MGFIDYVLCLVILYIHATLIFDILDDVSKGKISKAESGVFVFIFSVFTVIGLVIILV